MRAADSFRINPYKPEQRMPGLNHISDQMLRDNGSNFSDQRSIDKPGHGEQPALAERAARHPFCLLATARQQTGPLTRRKELFNGEYRNTAKGMQHHQVVIGSHDASRVSADGEFKKLVI